MIYHKFYFLMIRFVIAVIEVWFGSKLYKSHFNILSKHYISCLRIQKLESFKYNGQKLSKNNIKNDSTSIFKPVSDFLLPKTLQLKSVLY